MAFQVSPGVLVQELDLTRVIPAVSTSIGAFAGEFRQGPVDEIVTVSSEQQLTEQFGKPDANNFEEIEYSIIKKGKNFNLISNISLSELNIKNQLFLINFFPNINATIDLKDHKIKIKYNQKNLSFNGSGKIKKLQAHANSGILLWCLIILFKEKFLIIVL